jgi:hypothetical protein
MAAQEQATEVIHNLHFQWLNQQLIISYLKQNYTDDDKNAKHLLDRKNLFWHRDRVYIPNILRVCLIKMYHDAPTVVHPGVAITLAVITRTFSWPGVRSDIFDYIKTCDSCQRVKAKRSLKTGKLLLLVPEPKPWSTIGMDMITKLPLFSGYGLVLVVVDLLSKMAHFIPCKEAALLAMLANLFCKHIFCIHGLLDKIISDRGSMFVSRFWQTLMTSLDIKSSLSTAYHPQTDGQMERTNQTLEDYLRHFFHIR